MECPECYSDNPRITPLRGQEHCLRTHMQYICSTCGRHVCIQVDEYGKCRWKFPLKSLEIAKLYLKPAEIMCEDVCGIYEMKSKSGRTFFKIFHRTEDLLEYLRRNPDRCCEAKEPAYISKKYVHVNPEQVRRLTGKEVEKYLEEQQEKKYHNGT